MTDQKDKGRIWLYENNYAKTDKHPIKTGPGEISKDVLRKLVELTRQSGEDVVKIQCAAWERISKNGNPYTFVTIEPHEERKPQLHEPREEQGTSQPRPTSGSDEIPF